MIELSGLTKRYGDTLAVDDLSVTVTPGCVTGFLGPNGAGKTTTMRLVLGLDAPTSGWAHVAGRDYADLRFPLHEVGALLDAKAAHPGRSARNHLRCLAESNRIPVRRVDEVLGVVGLADVAGKRVGTFSLGMGQRLGIAAALLGDPGVLMFDEPVNGLDPEGIVWIRHLLRSLAAEGRTVFVSSHLMTEMALTADRLIVVGRGRLIADATVDEITRMGGRWVRVRSPRAAELATAITAAGGAVTAHDDHLQVRGLDEAEVGDLAAASGIAVHQLYEERQSLEQVFFELTDDAVEFHGSDVPHPAVPQPVQSGS
jgi:ABC-2 type transport system ATP-binding protein